MFNTDAITALGYTPYNSTNLEGYTDNIFIVISLNNVTADITWNVPLQIRSGPT